MPDRTRKRADRRLPGEARTPEAVVPSHGGKWVGFAIVAAVIVLIILIVGVFYYLQNVAPLRRTIIQVDDKSISMGYFIKRARMSGADPLRMLDSLTSEQLILVGAARYGVYASPEDIENALLASATSGNQTMTQAEFREWYRQRVNESNLTEAQYREIAVVGILAERLEVELAKTLPTVAEQVHLNMILVRTLEEAEKVKARLDVGENFADVAREVSLDSSKEQGGDKGWVPRGVILPGFEEVAFSLNITDVSDPLPYGMETSDPEKPQELVYYLLMVSEKADARELDAAALEALRGTVLDKWLAEERSFHTIKYSGLRKNFDSETYAWLNWQIAKK